MAQYLPAPEGDASPGVAPGGLRGQYLRKASDRDFDTDWEDVGISMPGASAAPKGITIAQPKPGDQFTLFYTQQATTLTQVLAIVRGDTPSTTFELRYGADRSAAGTLATVPETITNTTTGEPVTVQNMPIPADQFLWIVVTAVSGQVEELNVCVEL